MKRKKYLKIQIIITKNDKLPNIASKLENYLLKNFKFPAGLILHFRHEMALILSWPPSKVT